jgi:hypothetical protein
MNSSDSHSISQDQPDTMSMSTMIRAEWVSGIADCISALENMNVETEDGFLSVGSQLQTMYTRTKEISQDLTKVMNNFASEGQSRLTAKMREITETSTRYLGNFETTSHYAVEHLGSVMTIIDELPEKLKEFERLVSQLRIMGITTRIETERLGLHHLGFEILADEVTALGENISLKAKDVQASIRTISGIVKGNENNLTRLRSTHHGLQLSVARTMNEDLQLLGEKHEVLVQVVDNITRQSQDSIHSINAIVEALQFHDITRQQIEHVVDALKDLQRQLTDDGADDPLPFLILVCELQPVQLERARSEFMNAVLSLISSFGSLSNTIAMMQAESCDAIGFADGDGSTFFSVIGVNLQRVTQALLEGEKGIHEFLSSLGEIESVVQNMKVFMDQMSEAGDEVELLALNSRVRAAKTRERGAALGVIAESIQRISTMAELHIADVVGSIAALVTKTEQMHELAASSNISSAAESPIEAMTVSLRVMIDEFASSSALGKAILEQAAHSSVILGKELDTMATAVRNNHRVGETLERIEQLLSSIASEARADAPAFVLSEVEHRLEEMNDRYTMHAERDTHAAYISGADPGLAAGSAGTTESSIELF